MHLIGIPPEIWFPVITLIVGASLKALFDSVTDRRTARREREAREEQRTDSTRLRRIEFQRATLLELQETLLQLMRFTYQVHHHDLISHHESGAWQKGKLPEEIDEGSRVALANFNKFRVRISDKFIRQIAKDLSTTCAQIGITPDKQASEQIITRALLLSQDLQEKIGDALRTLDSDEDKITNDT
jgi:hypothetical protein